MPYIARTHRIKIAGWGLLGLVLVALLFALPGHVSAMALIFSIPVIVLPVATLLSHRDNAKDGLAADRMRHHYAEEHPHR
jgi:hypothetical protein